MTTKISIALASYNGENYIWEQLESFTNQTRHPDELIICDDCSTDRTLEIVKKFAQKAPFPVQVTANKKNIGYIKNFSNALALCSGDIVLISDQDDVWLPTKIAIIESYFSAHTEVRLVIHDIAYCKQDLTPIGQTKIERMRDEFDLDFHYVVGMASAIRGDFLKHCLPIPQCGRMTHDRWLHSCAHALGAKVIVGDMLALHRRHNNNVTKKSLLNVDFITSYGHFSPHRLSLTERMKRMRCDILSNSEESSVLLDWLTRNRDVFVEAGYGEPAELDNRIDNLRLRHEAEVMRTIILTAGRLEGFINIINLYRSGGYCYFRGWKSIIGDIIFRCFFHL